MTHSHKRLLLTLSNSLSHTLARFASRAARSGLRYETAALALAAGDVRAVTAKAGEGHGG